MKNYEGLCYEKQILLDLLHSAMEIQDDITMKDIMYSDNPKRICFVFIGKCMQKLNHFNI